MLAHQKAADGDAKLDRGWRRTPARRRRRGLALGHELNQARAVTLGIEHLRSLAPIARARVVWQLNDCWPVTSWAGSTATAGASPLCYAMRPRTPNSS